ncbi:hypothetical protein [Paenibacillus hexagrammi]|uniref:Uncharacterized protein n=1 Tax=Paenibacillus hexagrammi TaxID=2908839 RepID=A0ABY3STA6_9BACL|nr:hypothetical protein [Paenibacillus sp. YPD9-1]UJF36600.1 hypothetical protein L0M14_30390 [Paenibacillus sp. YPD9-1]
MFKYRETWIHTTQNGRDVAVTCDYFEGAADVICFMDADIFLASITLEDGDLGDE